jgi:hypothetical protein
MCKAGGGGGGEFTNGGAGGTGGSISGFASGGLSIPGDAGVIYSASTKLEDRSKGHPANMEADYRTYGRFVNSYSNDFPLCDVKTLFYPFLKFKVLPLQTSRTVDWLSTVAATA